MIEPTEHSLIVVAQFVSSDVRDFVICRHDSNRRLQALHPFELLKLERTVALIERLAEQQPALAQAVALGRLLIPALRERGVGRHLAIEEWSEADLRGETLSKTHVSKWPRNWHVSSSVNSNL